MTAAVGQDAGPGSDDDPQPRVGFFTDTTLCIGCKACEVACNEWNLVPEKRMEFTGESYDNTSDLGADAWRHVAFIEQPRPPEEPDTTDLLTTGALDRQDAWPALGDLATQARPDFRWLMSSDVCKHCTHAACLEVCPTGSLFRTEFGTVVVQEDICNGCGYCVPACPYGVIDQRKEDGRVWKCTLCYDRLRDDMEPACSKACPTDSIQFAPLDELRDRAAHRLEAVRSQGYLGAQLYGHDDNDGVGGAGAFFLLLDDPEVYGLPPDPIVTTRDLTSMWRSAAAAAAVLAGVVVTAALGGRR